MILHSSFRCNWLYSSDYQKPPLCKREGWYGVPEGMMFYMPVIYTSPGQYHVVDDLPLPSAVLRKIRAIVKVHYESILVPRRYIATWLAIYAIQRMPVPTQDKLGRLRRASRVKIAWMIKAE